MNEAQKPALERLVRATISKGIPPFLVASNISEPEYLSVHLTKDAQGIHVRTECTGDEDGTWVFHYTYTLDQTLQRIEAEIGGRRSIYWDRDADLKRLADEVVQSGPSRT